MMRATKEFDQVGHRLSSAASDSLQGFLEFMPLVGMNADGAAVSLGPPLPHSGDLFQVVKRGQIFQQVDFRQPRFGPELVPEFVGRARRAIQCHRDILP